MIINKPHFILRVYLTILLRMENNNSLILFAGAPCPCFKSSRYSPGAISTSPTQHRTNQEKHAELVPEWNIHR